MKSVFSFLVLSCLIFTSAMAQKTDSSDANLPYFQIPDSPENYSSGNVLGRMIDGLGYRYYWATEGLNDKDLSYKPSKDGRNIGETNHHIYSLSLTIVNGVENKPNIRTANWSDISFEEKRKATLENLERASERLKSMTEEGVAQLKVSFQNGDRKTEFPFWNMINGPIADAIYHTGQVVMMRRSAGNPLPSGVNVLTGKTRE